MRHNKFNICLILNHTLPVIQLRVQLCEVTSDYSFAPPHISTLYWHYTHAAALSPST